MSAEHLEHLLLKLHGLQILLERLLLFFQQRQHAQVLPRAAEVPAVKGKQSELAGRSASAFSRLQYSE